MNKNSTMIIKINEVTNNNCDTLPVLSVQGDYLNSTKYTN